MTDSFLLHPGGMALQAAMSPYIFMLLTVIPSSKKIIMNNHCFMTRRGNITTGIMQLNIRRTPCRLRLPQRTIFIKICLSRRLFTGRSAPGCWSTKQPCTAGRTEPRTDFQCAEPLLISANTLAPHSHVRVLNLFARFPQAFLGPR
jgi:hypothetical protein